MLIDLNTSFKLNNLNNYCIRSSKTMNTKSPHLCFKSKTSIRFDKFESPTKLVKDAIKNEIQLFNIKNKKGDYYLKHFSDLYKTQEILINKIQNNLPTYKKLNFSYDNLLDKYILGYQKEKEALMTSLIEPLLLKKTLFQVEAPPAILISGNNKITDALVSTVSVKLKKDLNILYLNDNISITKFEDLLLNILRKARTDYIKTGKRTILIYKNAERFLSFHTAEANIIGRKLNEEDNKKLAELNKKTTGLVPYFKALLDVVAKDPTNRDASSMTSATTFIMTSENPHFIHPDLSEREGKIIHIKTELPQDNNLKDIIFSSINKIDPNFKDFLSEEDWDLIIKELNPNFTKGAFSAKYLDDIITNIYYKKQLKYSEDFKKEIFLIRYLLEQPRDISTIEYKKQKRISEIFNKTQKQHPTEFEEIENLILQESFGDISTEDKILLKIKMDKIKSLRAHLNNKAHTDKLSEKELKLMQEIEHLIKLEFEASN